MTAAVPIARRFLRNSFDNFLPVRPLPLGIALTGAPPTSTSRKANARAAETDASFVSLLIVEENGVNWQKRWAASARALTEKKPKINEMSVPRHR